LIPLKLISIDIGTLICQPTITVCVYSISSN
jgi:hypothetical protein